MKKFHNQNLKHLKRGRLKQKKKNKILPMTTNETSDLDKRHDKNGQPAGPAKSDGNDDKDTMKESKQSPMSTTKNQGTRQTSMNSFMTPKRPSHEQF